VERSLGEDTVKVRFAVAAAALIAGALAFGAQHDSVRADNPSHHIATFVKLSGDYATSHGTPWEILAPYIDYLDIDQRGSEAAHNAGIKVGFYSDVHLVCKGTACSGSPNVEDVQQSAFAHSCSGARVYTSDDSDANRKLLGDPRKPALLQAFNTVIDNKLHNQFGNFHEDFVIDDDVFIPDAPWFGWHANSPTGPRLDTPYCGYSTSSYVQAIKTMEAKAHIPVILNGLNGKPDFPYIEHASNVIGGICEDCLHASYDPARNREAAPIWNQELDAALATGRQKKVWIDYPHSEIDNDTQGYIYASLMLVYRERAVALHEDIDTPSGIALPPTVMLVPHGSLQPLPNSIEGLKRSSGLYAREFSRCDIDGRPMGPCAAVVNPDAQSSHAWPFPASRYRHTIQISGKGIVHELGDTGRLGRNGAPPAASIGPRGWAIAFR
jgi:hypothetical protein